jgi:3-phenylpropionate/trans-cinnamate dioxygenase ferredoxin reductase component
MSAGTIVVVGAGLAGSRCAETLRGEGFGGRIVVFGDEPHAPYERPALSKELLAGARESVDLRPEGFWAEREIELRLGERIDSVDLLGRTAGGVHWDALVIATGARARRLPGEQPDGVHVLRTRSDADALRAELEPGSRLCVIGAGFVGAEAASTALELGVDVTLVEAAPRPFIRALGSEVGGLLADHWRARGADVRLGSGVEQIEAGPDGRARAVVLGDGARIDCAAVLVGIGVTPAGELLGEDAGIPTDACGRTALPDVYACGDVASAYRPTLGRRLRVEHWTSASGQAAAVAHAILGRERPYDDLPYFWSDQFGLRLQYVGHAEDWHRVEIDGGPSEFTVRYLDEARRPLAALVANRPREIGALRRELGSTLAEAA